MAYPRQADVTNRLLARLKSEDYDEIAPHLELIDLVLRWTVMEFGVPVAFVYFPENGLISLVAQTDERIEVGMVGYEGVAGISGFLDDGPSAFSGIVQGEGKAYRVPASVFRRIVRERPSLLDYILRYTHFLMTQSAQTAYANASSSIEQRLARWILMTHDRLRTDDLPLTHDFLSLMLGTRRSSVTAATHALEGHHLIRATRGLITVRDREKLRAFAGGAYGLAETEYDRMFGTL